MPASAVARRTPASSGMSGTLVGASGETEEDMMASGNRREALNIISPRWRGEVGWRRNEKAGPGDRSRPGSQKLHTISARLLLRRRRHLGVLGRVGGLGSAGRRVGGLVHALDLGALAQLADIVGLRLARDIGLDLGLDLIELRRLAVALFLDLDDVPAELRLHGVGNLAGLERESDRGKLRHHLLLGEEAEVAAVGSAGILGFLLGEFGEIRPL